MMHATPELEKYIREGGELGINADIVKAALTAPNAENVRALFERLQAYNAVSELVEEFAWAILEVVRDAEIRFDVGMLLLELQLAQFQAVGALAKAGNPQALPMIREVLTIEWLRIEAASAVIILQYNGQPEQALNDEAEFVRHNAAKQLEKQGNAAALIQALNNDSALVRRIAAWYMGRRAVKAAVEPLISLVQAEDDIEALRAGIWSLGVLRDDRAIETIKPLGQHANPLVANAVQEALNRLSQT